MKTVFICHSSTDKTFARRLVQDLQQHGIQPWIDEGEIRVGDSLLEKIEDGLSRSDFVVVVLSRKSVSRQWVVTELRAALNLEISRKKTLVLPVLREECPVPLFLRDKRYADFSKKYRLGLEELIEAIEPTRDGLQKRLDNVHGKAIMEMKRLDGSLAQITKEVTLRCREGRVDSFIDSLSSDATKTSVSVTPGQIVETWREGGKTYFRSQLDRPLEAGQSVTRRVSIQLYDSFPDDEEAFDMTVHYPTTRFTGIIRFLKGRPPLTWQALERNGPDLVPRDGDLARRTRKGKPELRLEIRKPRLGAQYVIRWTW